MRLEQLSSFLEVAKHSSLASASRNLHMTQQALSASIKNMEAELGVTLLRRSSRGVALPSEGRQLLAFAADVIPRYRELTAGFTSASGDCLRGTLRVYVNTAFYLARLFSIVERYCARYPRVRVVTSTLNADGIRERMLSPAEPDTYSIGILNVPVTAEGRPDPSFLADERLTFHPLAEGGYHACVGQTHPLARRRSVSLRRLIREPIIGGAADEMCNTPLYSLLSRYGRPNIVLATTSLNLWSHSIANNVGIGFLHDIFLDGAEPFRTYLQGITTIDIRESMTAVTGYLLNGEPGEILKSFISFLPRGNEEET